MEIIGKHSKKQAGADILYNLSSRCANIRLGRELDARGHRNHTHGPTQREQSPVSQSRCSRAAEKCVVWRSALSPAYRPIHIVYTRKRERIEREFSKWRRHGSAVSLRESGYCYNSQRSRGAVQVLQSAYIKCVSHTQSVLYSQLCAASSPTRHPRLVVAAADRPSPRNAVRRPPSSFE